MRDYIKFLRKIIPQVFKFIISRFKPIILRWRKHFSTVFLIFVFYLLFFVHIEPYEIGISWNPFNGNMDTVEAGIHVMTPWKMISVVDLRPTRVCITSTARCNNCKLVQFDKRHWREFVQTQGFGYWWWNNMCSYNIGYDDEYRGFRDLMRGYAFANKKYSFIIVLDDSYSIQNN